MKKIILLSCIVLLVANLSFGAVLSFYGGFNMAVSSVVIICTGLLLYITDTINLKDGYKISLMLLFAISGFLEFVLSLIAPNRLNDNWWLILVIFLMTIEIILLVITNTISNKIK